MKLPNELLEISKKYYSPSKSAKEKIEKVLEKAELEAYKGQTLCYIPIDEQDVDYPEIKKTLLKMGYKIYTGKAYQEYITWR